MCVHVWVLDTQRIFKYLARKNVEKDFIAYITAYLLECKIFSLSFHGNGDHTSANESSGDSEINVWIFFFVYKEKKNFLFL